MGKRANAKAKARKLQRESIDEHTQDGKIRFARRPRPERRREIMADDKPPPKEPQPGRRPGDGIGPAQ